MEKDLHKRLEEARKQGYKEAVKVALKWLQNYDPDWSDIDSEAFEKGMLR